MQFQPGPVTHTLSPLHRQRKHLIWEIKVKRVTPLGKQGNIPHLQLTRVSDAASAMTYFSCFSFLPGAWAILSTKQPFGSVGALQTGPQGSLLKERKTHILQHQTPCPPPRVHALETQASAFFEEPVMLPSAPHLFGVPTVVPEYPGFKSHLCHSLVV